MGAKYVWKGNTNVIKYKEKKFREHIYTFFVYINRHARTYISSAVEGLNIKS